LESKASRLKIGAPPAEGDKTKPPPLVDQLAVVRLRFCCNVKPGENNFKQVIEAACGKI
jgi:hypothetical protein